MSGRSLPARQIRTAAFFLLAAIVAATFHVTFYAVAAAAFGTISLGLAARGYWRERRIDKAGIALDGIVTEVWLEIINRGKGGKITNWRVTAEIEGGPGGRRRIDSEPLPGGDPRPAIDVGSRITIQTDEGGSSHRFLVPPAAPGAPRAMPKTFWAGLSGSDGEPARSMNIDLGRFGHPGIRVAFVAIAGWALITGAVKRDPIVLVFGLLTLIIAAILQWNVWRAARFGTALESRGLRFAVPVLNVTRRYEKSLLGASPNSWIVTLQGSWPDGLAQRFAAQAADPALATLRPGPTRHGRG